jgi:hypothetical protein
LGIVLLAVILRLFSRIKLLEREVCLFAAASLQAETMCIAICPHPPYAFWLGTFECMEHVEAPLNVDYENVLLN